MSIKNIAILATETTILKPTSESLVLSLMFFNSDSISRTVTVYLYPTGGSAGDLTTVLVKSIPPKETLIWNGTEKFILDTNSTVSAKADVASVVNVCVGYKVV